MTILENQNKRIVYFTLSIIFSLWSVNYVNAQTFPPGFSQELVENGFSKPTQFTFAPDGRIFVCEQRGQVRIVKNGNLLARNFLKVNVNYNTERGLLGIALDPNFSSNNYLYIYYVRSNGSNCRISRFTAAGDTVVPGSETVLLDLDSIHSGNYNAGWMEFGPDGKLYVCVGYNQTGSTAQNLDSYFGKILRINPDGSAPAGNPFPTGSAQRRRVWAYGVRNPYTLAFQPGTGRLFMNDVGTTLWEEINDCTVGGKNFGWPGAEGNSSNPAFTNPIYSYGHGSASGNGCAITGGTFFGPASTNYPATYSGKYFYLDYCNNWIDMLTLNGATVTRSNFATGISGFSVGMAVGPDGNIYYLSRATQAIYRIVYGTASVKLKLSPVADAYVRGGTTNAITNFGKATTLNAQANATAGSNYETYLRFDLNSFSGAVSSAVLRVYGGLNSLAIPSLQVEAHNVSDITWKDTTITWNNKPIEDPGVLATTTLTGSSKEYYEWNITPQVIALKNAGATGITIKLNSTTANAARAVFNSKEASTFKPQLVISYQPSPQMPDNARLDGNGVADFQIYPNPAEDYFNIYIRNMEGNNKLEIFDLKGHLVMQKQIENGDIERIDTEMMENGLYLVTISNGSKFISKKVLLNKE